MIKALESTVTTSVEEQARVGREIEEMKAKKLTILKNPNNNSGIIVYINYLFNSHQKNTNLGNRKNPKTIVKNSSSNHTPLLNRATMIKTILPSFRK